jgi:hypothetical protein
MAGGFPSGALLGHPYELDDGLHVRLRLARPSDLPLLAELVERHRPRAGSELTAAGSELTAAGSELTAAGSELTAAGSELTADGSGELSAARFLHFDPRREWVLCAVGLIDGRLRLLGIGAIILGGEAERPHLLLAAREDVRRLLAEALGGAARVLARSRAA